MTYRVGADVGRTFTDVILQDSDGSASIRKLLSTPPRYDEAVIQAIGRLAEEKSAGGEIDEVIDGTTVATNAVLERRGSRIALVTGAAGAIHSRGIHSRSGSTFVPTRSAWSRHGRCTASSCPSRESTSRRRSRCATTCVSKPPGRTPRLALELVLKGGTVLDGTGGEPFTADVGIENGRIETVGVIDAPDVPTLDATGLYVAPGFIDIHSHSDHTLLVDPRAMSAVRQGVTLEVVGNCGFGYFPIRDPVEAKTAIYGCSEGPAFLFRDATEYFDHLDEMLPAINVLSLVPNGQLRFATVGLRKGTVDRQELGQMARLLEDSLDQGAWGYSTGLEYAWEGGATEEEITELCRVVAKAGGMYATHTRRRDEAAVEGVEEALRTAESSGVRLQISHLVPRNGLSGMNACVDSVEAFRSRGVDVRFDMHTRLFGLTYLHVALPPEAMAADSKALAELLASPSAREEMKPYRSMLSAGGTEWSKIVLFDNPVWPQYARRDIASIAAERDQEPLDAVYDLLLGAVEDTTRLMVTIHAYDEEQQRQIFTHELCMPGSDATTLAPDGPLAESFFHGAYTWASWFYRFMVRETGLLSPAEAVYRLSGMPAETLGLRDRGVLKAGARADVAIFDGARFADTGTTFEPNQLADGMVHVLVNGVVTLQDGQLTGDRAGEVLRRQ